MSFNHSNLPPAGETLPMPRYKCHKEVSALKIKQAYRLDNDSGDAVISFVEGHDSLFVSRDWYNKHHPEAGGYYVVYEDGYASYSPAKAFEEGYTIIDQNAEAAPELSVTAVQVTPVPHNPWECSDRDRIPYWQGIFTGETLRADIVVSVTSSADETVCHLMCGANVTIHHSDRQHPFGEALPSSLVDGCLVVSHLWLQWFPRDMFLGAYKKD